LTRFWPTPSGGRSRQLDLSDSGQVMLRTDGHVGYAAELLDDVFPAYAKLTGLA